MAGRKAGWKKPAPGTDRWWANKIAEAYNGHGPAGVSAEDLVRQLRAELTSPQRRIAIVSAGIELAKKGEG